MTMNLSSLFAQTQLKGPDCKFTGLASDSRTVEPGNVFFAVPGTHADGLAFVPQALAAGAVAIVSTQDMTALHRDYPAIGCVQVEDMRAALSQAAARVYPEQPDTIVAITGTSGKTSIAAFVRQIWLHEGFQAASLGTIGIVAPDGAVYGSLTTPDPITLHKNLQQLARAGVTHLALEASSHGLDQKRLDGVHLKAGAFTNLSRDHLDYHADFAAYLAAKMRLFNIVLHEGQSAVIDADSTIADEVLAICRARGLDILTTGKRGTGLRLISSRTTGLSTALELDYRGEKYALCLPLLGEFQVSNALVAAGLCLVTGGDIRTILSALEQINGAPGRLERVGSWHDAPIFIDYAHKPDALEKVLHTLRPLTKGRIIIVFGCGGDRDTGKRPIMGEIANRLADIVIITDDNPRSEDATSIRAQIMAAAPHALNIGDRGEAIAKAIGMLETGDSLLIAGKGHETGQIIGKTIIPFSDHESVQQSLHRFAMHKDINK
jgi:UDP-N-acetylmuramoyl-L-alanyl-D-glutamate--2,6-diaminopimelate ligase